MQQTTLILTDRDIARLIDLKDTIRVVRKATAAMARGEALMPPKLYLTLPAGDDFRAMPAFLRRPGASGIKWVNVHPRNPARGLPTVMALIILNDPATGFPLAVLDGRLVTKWRTAAAAAVAAQALARRNSHRVGLVGCGAQADAQLAALGAVFRLTHVNVWGYRRGEAEAFCRRLRRGLPRTRLVPGATVAECAREVDILVTVTPSRRPLVRRTWLSPGTHINAIGADAPGKQELDPRIVREARVVVDDREQAIHAGELNVPIREGLLKERHIGATLGQVLIGRRRGRRSDQELTLFDSTGLAIHDVALGAHLVRQAKARGIGREIRLTTTYQ